MIDRRGLLGAAVAAPALLMLGGRARGAGAAYPFTLGVASGEPSPDGMVLWTRLAPEPLLADGGMPARPVPVRWELAEDEHFARVVRHGDAVADPRWAHSVHVEPAGLAAGRPYWYRFIAGGETSPVGRTRTAPRAHAPVDRLRLCYGSCQKYEVGYYAAYRHMVAEDPDLIFFLGDYIYEGAPAKDALRPHRNPEPVDLPGYRVRYATYKSDLLLQAAHAVAPWLLTWDDHEVANDYAGALDQTNGDPAAFLLRRAAAYRAYWEHQPLRAAARPHGPAALLYRSLDWGDLAQFQIIDDRQYRGPRACQPPELAAKHLQYDTLVPTCADLTDPRRTMLGDTQEEWLMAALGRTRARWNLLAQQTLMAGLPRTDPKHPEAGPHLWSADTWSGYPVARDRIVHRWAEAGTPNPIALGGDIHSFAAADLHDPARPQTPVAAEFVGGSITSLFHDAHVKQEAAAAGIRFVENEVRGYGRVDLTRDHADVTFRGLADATKPDSAISDLARFAVEAGKPGIQAA